jgi:Flp pilus assembly protein TadG
MRRGNDRASRERGAVAVEFALVLPVLLMLLLGLFDYGWYFYCELSVTNAAREGARAGTTVPGGDAARAQATALGCLAGSLAAQPTTVNVVIGGAPTTVTVDVTMHFAPLVGFVPLPSDAKGHSVMQGVP